MKPKKRIIFTLLYSNGFFVLSRNFQIQKIGKISWLKKNYNFLKITKAIDELIVLNIRDKKKNFDNFCEIIKEISSEIFIPIAAGGGIKNYDDAKKILRSGADKIIVNTLLFNKKEIVKLSKYLGNNCIVGSIDVKLKDKTLSIWDNNKNQLLKTNIKKIFNQISKLPIGELYVNSIDRDGTGKVYFFEILNLIPKKTNFPIIIAGGAGNWMHLQEGLLKKNLSAVATANLLNFINDGLINARKNIILNKVDLPIW